MIEFLTLCGVDERTREDEVLGLAERFGNIEIGVLAGSRTGEEPRYPPVPVIERWRRFGRNHAIATALHLCGRLARSVAVGQDQDALALCSGFGRVQVNLPPGDRKSAAPQVHAFQQKLQRPVILQHDDFWEKRPGAGLNGIEYLFDRSGGRGIELIGLWPNPPAGTRVGYAGGIGPETIDKALAFAKRYRRDRIWLDMESRIRTDDWFDVELAGAVCDAVQAATRREG